MVEGDLPTEPLRPIDEYTQKVVQSRRRGAPYPYELVKLLVAPRAGGRADVSGGSFQSTTSTTGGSYPWSGLPGGTPPASSSASSPPSTDRYPRAWSASPCSVTRPRRSARWPSPSADASSPRSTSAESLGVPLEWFALSAGARIAMDSGTENMDWIADVLRRIIEFTQAGGEINVVVTGINVGAQPYWNAEATMLMHTKGILVMTPDSAMVLTGKQALDYSGSVSAEDNLGIGGYERIMGPNGQGQYWAPDLPAAIGVLLAHYDHSYVVPGERFPRRAAPRTRPTGTSGLPPPARRQPDHTVGDIFSSSSTPSASCPSTSAP